MTTIDILQVICYTVSVKLNFKSLEETWISGELWEVGYIISYVLMGLAGIAQANLKKSDLLSEDSTIEPIQFKWAVYLPYICEIPAFLLLVWGYNHPLPISFSALSLSVGTIIGLVVIRQTVALNENAQLFKAAQKEIKEREAAEKEIKQLNEDLEHRVAQRTSWLEAEIAERNHAELALKASERRLGDIIDFLPDAALVLNKEGKVIVWNKAIEAMTGIKAEAILGKGNFAHSVPFYGYERPILIDLVLGKYEGYKDEYVHFEKDSTGVTGEVFIPTLGPHGSTLWERQPRFLMLKAT